ncbi:hypothetical protein MYCTH_2306006, partial [Thermothelomyces thermophilus ATCC 42464]
MAVGYAIGNSGLYELQSCSPDAPKSASRQRRDSKVTSARSRMGPCSSSGSVKSVPPTERGCLIESDD